MREILGFLVMMVASLFDPIRTPGYIISGWLIKNCGLAIIVSIAWNVLLYVIIILPVARLEKSEPSGAVFLSSCCGAALATFVTNLIATRIRKSREAEQKKQNEEERKK